MYKDMREIEMYSARMLYGQMAKENILYLKRFVKTDSELGQMMDRWYAGDFRQVRDDYFRLRSMTDIEYGNCDQCEDDSNIQIRTKRAEEHFVRTLYGEEGLERHRKQWGTESEGK